jgi:hypothetical protein
MQHLETARCVSAPSARILQWSLRSPAVALCLAAACSPQHAASGGGGVQVRDLCITEGALETTENGHLSVNVSKMRAYVNRATSDMAELQFTYLGPTAETSVLGSGAVRTQFGLKLRAQDACNLLYVMWRVQPVPELVVSLKSNPGQSTSAQCANNGYQNLKPQTSAAIPVLAPGDAHKLRGEIQGQELRAYVDGKLVWQGPLDATGVDLKGPVGMRTDNAHLEFTLVSNGTPGPATPCKTGPGESD